MDPAKRDLPNGQKADLPSGEGARQRSWRLRWLVVTATLLLSVLLTVGAAFARGTAPDLPASAPSGELLGYTCTNCPPVAEAPDPKPVNALHWLIALASIGMMTTVGMVGMLAMERPRQ
jgi:hypothetical protein